MKKLFVILLFAYLSLPVMANNLDFDNTITNIENNIYGFSYDNDNRIKRIERLEKTVYGDIVQGKISKRIAKLSSDMSADVIGKEISPKEDSFIDDEETTIKEDNNVKYPIVEEIEQKLFNKTSPNRDFHSRIVAIEKKLFNKVYDVDDYSTRMDRIKAEIMPNDVNNIDKFKNEYRDNRISSNDLSGTRRSWFSNPFGQRNYNAGYSEEYNNNDYITYKQSPLSRQYENNLNNELSKLEMETFGTEFSNEDSTTRIKRLNSVNKAKKSSSKYDSQKFSQRMSTAMEIGAMILMILAMVL